MRAIGFMSGTSLDGMDAALIETDGLEVTRFGPALTQTFSAAERAALQTAVDEALEWGFHGPEPHSFAPAAAILADSAARAMRAILAQDGAPNVDIIGFHGQTVLHKPPAQGQCGQTCQIGDAQVLADLCQAPVIADFRTKDMALGGQGAPLATAYHAALAHDMKKPVVVLNLGGVGNLTWVGTDGALLAFDTGPANGPIDAWVHSHGRGHYDADGALAAAGRVNEAALEALLVHDFYKTPPPKSADRWDFDLDAIAGLSVQDGAATLCALCAKSIAQALRWLPVPPKEILVTGGGRHNPVLMRAIARHCAIPAVPVETYGWRGDALEAEAFAFLAVRHVRGLPISWPQTTGANRPVCGGRRFEPEA